MNSTIHSYLLFLFAAITTKNVNAVQQLRGGVRLLEEQKPRCPKKRVRIHTFCIDGYPDLFDYAQIQLSMNGKPLNTGHIDMKQGACNQYHHQPIEVDEWKTLTVGTEEVDFLFGTKVIIDHDRDYAEMNSGEWHSDTCDPYEIQIAKQHTSEEASSKCYNLGGGTTLDAYGVPIKLDLGFNDCSEWTQPSESYRWFIEVEPILE